MTGGVGPSEPAAGAPARGVISRLFFRELFFDAPGGAPTRAAAGAAAGPLPRLDPARGVSALGASKAPGAIISISLDCLLDVEWEDTAAAASARAFASACAKAAAASAAFASAA